VRWFIVFLIVANVILFFWVQQQSRPLPGEASLPPPDVGRLRLLTELEKEPAIVHVDEPEPARVEEMPVEPPFAAVSEAQSQPIHVEEALQSSLDAGGYQASSENSLPEGEPVTDIEPVEVTSFITEVNQSLGAESEDLALEAPSRIDEVAEAVTLEARTGIDEPVEQALEESVETPVREPGLLVPELPAEAAVVEPAAVESVQTVCARVGPFEPDDADELTSGLPATVTLLSDVTEEYASVDRYYVLIPPLPSRAEGYQKLKELADAGITDTWLFPSGEYRNAISLGFFSREAGAKRHAANVAGKGFNTEVKEKTSVRQRRWLLLMSNDGRDLGPGLSLPAGVAAEQQACP
jgi:hypothetical protein